jgi:hypothetical protein
MIGTIGWISLAIGACAGAVPILRAYAVSRAMDRLEWVAHSLFKEAVKRDRAGSNEVIELHDSIIDLAMHAPLIGAGVVKINHRRPPTDDDGFDDFTEFLNSNAWVLPYLGAAYYCLLTLEGFGRPWHLSNLAKALSAAYDLKFASAPDGGLIVVRRADQSSSIVEVIKDTSRRDDLGSKRKLVSC